MWKKYHCANVLTDPLAVMNFFIQKLYYRRNYVAKSIFLVLVRCWNIGEYMNDKYCHKVLDIESVCLVRVPSSWYHVTGDIIISFVLFVCRTYQNIPWVHCNYYSQVGVRVQKTHYSSREIDTIVFGVTTTNLILDVSIVVAHPYFQSRKVITR